MPATMTPSVVDLERPVRPKTGGGGGGPRKPLDRRGWGGDSGGGDGFVPGDRVMLAVWIAICAILMFFAAIASAMVVRRIGPDWRALELPNALWVSTSLLFFSSATLEVARRAAKRGGHHRIRRWTTATAVLGGGFVIAQLAGWWELQVQGISANWNASSSFFYLLTAAHGLHVLGGLAVLGHITWRAWSPRPWPRCNTTMGATALYWHFMDILWIFLLVLMVVWG